MRTIELKNAMANLLGHVTKLDQSRSSKVTTSHVTQEVKQKNDQQEAVQFCTTLSPYMRSYNDIILIEIIYKSKDS